MRQSGGWLIGVVIVFWCIATLSWAASPGFQGIGQGTFVYEVSGDGSTVVGRAADGHAAIWRASAGWTELQKTGSPFTGYAYDASYDGSVVVGWTGLSGGTIGNNRAFCWTANAGVQLLPLANSTDYGSHALSISADGSTIVGTEELPSGVRFATRWSAASGTVDMRAISGMPSGNWGPGAGVEARGVSNDGSTIVGCTQNTEAYPWIWTASSNTVTKLPSPFVSVLNVSADGSAVVGVGLSTTSGAALWTAGGGAIMLHVGDNAEARDISRDGSLVTGYYYQNGLDQTAFVWDQEHGFRNLQDMLVNDYHLDLSGWRLLNWAYVSDDGLTFAGRGLDANGNFGGWVATIPEPSTLALLGIGAISLLTYARRRRKC